MSASPALGFDPAPGHPATVFALAAKLRSSAASLGEASRVVDALVSNSGAWQGEAATAFRASLSKDLPQYLRSAHTSLAEAARRLGSWHDTLVANRSLAARYEAQAAAATTQDDLDDARRLARELASEHSAAASGVARLLDSAADRLAPKEPGVFASVWHKIVDDPADALSDASAILGAVGAGVGLFFPPAGLAVMLVAGGLSLAALGMHLADPKFRKPLTDGFTKGEFGADFWKSGVTLLGDTAGAVPGVAAVAVGAKAGTAATRAALAAAPEVSALAGLGEGAGSFARTTWSTGLRIQEIENPITAWALRSTSPTVTKSVGPAMPAVGAVTATAGYFSDSDSLEQTSTAVDGVRGVVDDAPSAGAKVAHAVSVMRP
ncbi:MULTISPECIES: hypothetical protein [unclassified Streptomyces]|uniref:hypothetical protein n=1 Tax=unclassified Streptomyces TaxID=2593676 RepID=UPI001BE7DBF0|nr:MULTISPECIES: hypothetical protein [unclassified Streptomyces]MBT2407367.1 hypothetical protein [Streptomyces sp. ISL-21]MBT2611046.1 hypothetical protein [Streptomyces sp. ISL-87]